MNTEQTEAKIIKVYESFNGSYWYLTEFLYEQEDQFSEHDKIYFGYAVLAGLDMYAEWGNIAEAELFEAYGKPPKSTGIWEVPKENWKFCKHYDKVIKELQEAE